MSKKKDLPERLKYSEERITYKDHLGFLRVRDDIKSLELLERLYFLEEWYFDGSNNES